MIRDRVIGSISSISASSICLSPGSRVRRNSTFHCARVTPCPHARRSNALRSACAVSAISKGSVSIGYRYSKLAYIKQRLSCARVPAHFRCRGRPSADIGPLGGRRSPMQFVWLGFLKSSAPIDPSIQEQINQFLQQPYLPIVAAGVLRDGEQRRAGYLAVFEAEDRAAAEALAEASPIRQAGLYSEFHLFEFQNEIG